MKNYTKKSLKVNHGITLISLVITIIVLLIMAGVSINVLHRDDNIINEAKDARNQTEATQEQTIISQIIVHSKDKSKFAIVEKKYVKEELDNYSEIKSYIELDNGIQVTFKSNNSYIIGLDGNIYHSIEEIPIQKTKEEIKKDNILAPTNIGKKVKYVSAYSSDLIWRLLYADNDYVYLISSKLDENNNEIEAQRTNYGGLGGLGLISDNIKGENYSGASNITDEFLKSLNSKWHAYLENDANEQYRTSESAKSVAWFMDQSKWETWKDTDNNAAYAIGGPTIELLIKSFNATAESNSQNKINLTINNGGYDPDVETSNMLKHEYNNGIYHLDGGTNAFWLASPGGNNEKESDMGLRIRTSGGGYGRVYGIYFGWSNYNLGLRPVVIIPMYKYIESNYDIIE